MGLVAWGIAKRRVLRKTRSLVVLVPDDAAARFVDSVFRAVPPDCPYRIVRHDAAARIAALQLRAVWTPFKLWTS